MWAHPRSLQEGRMGVLWVSLGAQGRMLDNASEKMEKQSCYCARKKEGGRS